jgi:hypothetical protein
MITNLQILEIQDKAVVDTYDVAEIPPEQNDDY